MNKINHITIEIIAFLLLWGVFDEIRITMIIIPMFWGAMFPDFDHQINSHRNIMFHSILPNVLYWWYNPDMIATLMIFAVAIHLLCDMLPMFYKKGGYSTIHYWAGRLNTRWSMIWMLTNIVGASVILVWTLI